MTEDYTRCPVLASACALTHRHKENLYWDAIHLPYGEELPHVRADCHSRRLKGSAMRCWLVVEKILVFSQQWWPWPTLRMAGLPYGKPNTSQQRGKLAWTATLGLVS